MLAFFTATEQPHVRRERLIKERKWQNQDRIAGVLCDRVLTLDFFKKLNKEELFKYVADVYYKRNYAERKNRLKVFNLNIKKAERIYIYGK